MGIIGADNLGALMKTPRATAPARPDAEPEIIHGQFRRRHNIEHAHQCLHAVEFAAHIFTEYAALEVGQDGLGFQGAANLPSFASAAKQPARKGKEEGEAEHDPVNRERGEAVSPDPVEKPGDDGVGGNESGDKTQREHEPEMRRHR